MKLILHKLIFIFSISFLLFACKEDTADLQKQWTDMQSSVVTKATEVKSKTSDISSRMKSIPGFNPSDTSAFGKLRNELDKLVYSTQSIISESDAILARNQTSVEEAIKKGKRGDIETALNNAKQEFDAANMKLANAETMIPNINSLFQKVSEAATRLSNEATSATTTNKEKGKEKGRYK